MKKLSLIALLLSIAVLMQYCKKSDDTTDTTTTTSTVLFNAYVNGVIWTPAKITPVLTYDATAKTKTFVWTADSTSNKMVLSLKLASTKVDSGFTVKTYVADTTGAANPVNNLNYYKYVSGVATSVGNVKSGFVIISAIDSVKKTITGTFAFSQTKLNYDGSGNLVSVTSTAVTSGQFNALPYTFKKQ